MHLMHIIISQINVYISVKVPAEIKILYVYASHLQANGEHGKRRRYECFAIYIYKQHEGYDPCILAVNKEAGTRVFRLL